LLALLCPFRCTALHAPHAPHALEHRSRFGNGRTSLVAVQQKELKPLTYCFYTNGYERAWCYVRANWQL
jgi:hypothetical protein